MAHSGQPCCCLPLLHVFAPCDSDSVDLLRPFTLATPVGNPMCPTLRTLEITADTIQPLSVSKHLAKLSQAAHDSLHMSEKYGLFPNVCKREPVLQHSVNLTYVTYDRCVTPASRPFWVLAGELFLAHLTMS
jgi:hypothetical protein